MNNYRVESVYILKVEQGIYKRSFHLSFNGQILDRLTRHSFFYLLDDYLGYNEIVIALEDQEKTTLTCPYDTLSLGGWCLNFVRLPPHLKHV